MPALIAGLLLFAAVVPAMPELQRHVDATFLAGTILAVGMYAWFRTRGPGWTPLDMPALALLLVATLATVFSVDPVGSFFPSTRRGEGLLVYVAYVLAALSAARLVRSGIGAVLAGSLIAGSLVGAIALAQYYGLDIRWLGVELPYENRAYATLGNSVFLGGYVNLLLPLGASLAVQARGKAWWLLLAACALLYGALLSSQTRTSWIAAAVAFILLVGLLEKSPSAYRRLVVLAMVFATVTVVMVLTRPQALLLRRAASAFDVVDSSLQVRLYVWKHTLPLIAQRPVLGWGFSTLLGRFPDVGSPEWRRLFGLNLVGVDTPHNDVLHFAYSAGLLGLAAYLWVWTTVGVSLRVALAGRTGVPGLTEGLIASMAAYLLWLQFAWNQMGPANVFWVLAGVAVAQARGSRG